MAQVWHLKSYPEGLPSRSDFDLRDVVLPEPAEGEVQVRNRWISLDPITRRTLSKTHEGLLPRIEIGGTIPSPAVGEVIRSRAPGFRPGDIVKHKGGWATEANVPAASLVPVEPGGPDEKLYLSYYGVIGLTAYVGLFGLGEPRPGKTIFVSAAGGAVGSCVVQMAKIAGMRVIGSAGGADKCAMVQSIGADAAIDYKASGTLGEKLAAAAPEGIDMFFDNVGGDHLDAAIGVANLHARFILCGMAGVQPGDPPVEMHNLARIVARRIWLMGYITGDHPEYADDFRRDMAQWLADGRVRPVETVRHGIEEVPDALGALFSGGVMGKMLVKV